MALGALPFVHAFEGYLVIPRFTMGTSRDADGVTRRWATAVGPADTPLPDTDELFDAVIWQYGHAAAPAVGGARAEAGAGSELTTAMDSDGYAAMVADAVAAMGAPGATLRKVVLSRPVSVRLDGPLPLSTVLAPAARRRAQLHHLLHARPRRLLLRGEPRAAGGPSRRAGVVLPLGRDGAPGRHRPLRRRRAA